MRLPMMWLEEAMKDFIAMNLSGSGTFEGVRFIEEEPYIIYTDRNGTLQRTLWQKGSGHWEGIFRTMVYTKNP